MPSAHRCDTGDYIERTIDFNFYNRAVPKVYSGLHPDTATGLLIGLAFITSVVHFLAQLLENLHTQQATDGSLAAI
jgi:hypothetical protein